MCYSIVGLWYLYAYSPWRTGHLEVLLILQKLPQVHNGSLCLLNPHLQRRFLSPNYNVSLLSLFLQAEKEFEDEPWQVTAHISSSSQEKMIASELIPSVPDNYKLFQKLMRTRVAAAVELPVEVGYLRVPLQFDTLYSAVPG